ncbi:MarR family winged helix-turn-helix transcriptional regulator [Nocardioides sp. GY 10127]|uniref:MarR family winged helix-turn-helix transcriptional regulator n=1 Tax=Nocardioides sp. GY 10127 TaxID=2569762 RepID=UPI0010A89475|nr:MarR family winged helix-turn-helix transcriptional regulator [Nocardioides sp. GY 10127]TIC79149.1 winged helix-turn-helix transcriptional regulator [Nocardioides sp. GY 10127]
MESPDAEQQPTPEVRWLSPDERASWLAAAALTVRLPNALDAQLQADQGLSFFEYMILAVLSEQTDRTLQMSDIAAATSASLSRLSHTVKRLENQGLVRRERVPGSGRRTNAILTEPGWEKVVSAAPGHVARVRELVIDVLEPDDLAALRRVSERVLARVDPDGAGRPPA